MSVRAKQSNLSCFRFYFVVFSLWVGVPFAPRASAHSGYDLVNAFGSLTFLQPVCIRTPPGETNRIFVVDKQGFVEVVTNLANPSKSFYINLRSNLWFMGEAGLLGMEFHPGFQTNGYFYIYRSLAVAGGNINERLSRFQAIPPNAPTASASTEVVLFDQRDPADNHNGGDLHFGPDGYLYVSLGDGGVDSDAFGNTQTIRKGFHSGILRLDVDQRNGNLAPNASSAISELTISTNYLVPADNPFLTEELPFDRYSNVPASSIRTEFWVIGLRNPWRFSIDPQTGRVWVGDVGEGHREEVNLVTKGGNYGWVYREGDLAFVSNPPAGFSSIDPLLTYPHGNNTNEGNSVTGGEVYHGTNLPHLKDAYIFGDYISGNIWSLRYDEITPPVWENLFRDGIRLKQTGIAAFGTDPRNGDILMVDYA